MARTVRADRPWFHEALLPQRRPLTADGRFSDSHWRNAGHYTDLDPQRRADRRARKHRNRTEDE